MYINVEDYRRQKAQHKKEKAHDDVMERIFSCRTREEVIAAIEARDAWVAEYGYRYDIYEVGEILLRAADLHGLKK